MPAIPIRFSLNLINGIIFLGQLPNRYLGDCSLFLPVHGNCWAFLTLILRKQKH